MPANEKARAEGGLRSVWGRGRRRAEDAAAAPAAAAPAAAETDIAAVVEPTPDAPVDLPAQEVAPVPEQEVLGAPVAGTAIPLAEVEDPAFSAGMIGPGAAVRPSSGEVVAPLPGVVVTAMPHAYGLRSDAGVEVLVHVGIDTVALGGRHFEPLVTTGERVAAGAPLVRVDLAGVAAEGCPTTVVVVVTNSAVLGAVEPLAPGPVTAGQPLLTVRTIAPARA
ncbi:MAG TPA: PTS glucose transporter subunit IIA [Cellulomonas sp.]